MVKTRPPAQAGRFYPASASELGHTVRKLLVRAQEASADASPIETGAVRGLIVPHAGYVFSGSTAARAFARLKGLRAVRVVIIAPAHTASFRGVAVSGADVFETPLGTVALDGDFIARLTKRSELVRFNERAHEREHAIEVELPFLQVALSDFRLVPLLMWEQDRRAWKELSDALAEAIVETESAESGGGATLLVASSDLYHGPGRAECLKKDRRMLELVEAGDAEGILREVEAGRTMACGFGPMAVVIEVSRRLGATRIGLLGHTTSYDELPRGEDYVVGYMAAALSNG